jgi:hypothetical protein
MGSYRTSATWRMGHSLWERELLNEGHILDTSEELALCNSVKRMFLILLAAFMVPGWVTLADAGNPPLSGKIISEQSVDCGTKKQGKKEQTDLLCQEYIVHTAATEYHIRQPKQKDQTLLPVNSPVEFVIDKDKMKLKVQGKQYEFLVVSETAVGPDAK